ncbi:hypothetical protein Acor_39930 [Acrocarpospora corrugata]|uniref:Tetratricopeptide repeat protein n=1 Tax=Acrocarpospora corrugata TaxID=35763 RepID=A0A5M3W5U9_9ACTN|nr:tetratricopeptide repeat protein [Acrocarpospora corrugata]GES01928.1 hypothetical protein Acor_39930 [Acrocarpospora corrugata]
MGVNPRGAALVAAAIDCRRAGYINPAPRALIEELHTTYLDARGGHRLRPEPLEAAWAWATQLRRATTALLTPMPEAEGEEENGAGGHVVVFDYLVDATQQAQGPLAHTPEPLIRTALTHVYHPDDADQIASTADRQGRYHLAEHVWRIAVIFRRQRSGEEHPDTLASRSNLASVLGDLGRLAEAETETRAVLEVRRRVLGEEHPDTLASRSNLASVLRALGREEE